MRQERRERRLLRLGVAAVAMLGLLAALAGTHSASGQVTRPIDELQWQTDCAYNTTDACLPGDVREERREQIDRTTDGAVSPAQAVVESGPPNACVADLTRREAEAIACAGAGGESADGRTYYKGSGPPKYECEYQRATGVDSTNGRFPKGVYNSIRVCRPGRYVYLTCNTRDGYPDRVCYDEGYRNNQELLSISHSARYRQFRCGSSVDDGYVRCAYDWVR